MAYSGSVEVGLSYLHQDVKSQPNLQTDPKAFFFFFLNESCLTNLTLNDFNFSLVSICDTFFSGLLVWSFPFHLQTCSAS